MQIHKSDLRRRSCPVCWEEETRFERLLAGFRLERCTSCGLVFANPQHTPEALDRIYRDKARPEDSVALYERIHTSAVLADYDRVLDLIERRVPGKGRLLDFACAAGYFYERALGRGWEGHGVDLGDWCRLAAEKRGLPNLHIGRLKDLAFPDHHFDVVVAAEVLEHLPEPRDDLAEVRRILKPGGLLFVTVPNYRCLAILLGRNRFSLNTPPQHINYFTPGTLRTLLEHTGFEVDRMFSGGGINWENILGRNVESDILEAYTRPEPGPAPAGSEPGPGRGVRASAASALKQLIYPAYDLVCNEWAKVGMGLVALATRPKGDFPP